MANQFPQIIIIEGRRQDAMNIGHHHTMPSKTKLFVNCLIRRDYHQSSGNEYHHRAAPPTQKRYRGQYDRGQQEYDRGQSDRGHQQYDRDRGGSSYYDRREESSPPPFDNNIRYYGGPSSQRDLSPIRKRHGGSPPPPYDGKPGPRFNGGPRRDYF